MRRRAMIICFLAGGLLWAQQQEGDIRLGGEFGFGINSLGDVKKIAAYPGFFYSLGIPNDSITSSQYGMGYVLGLTLDYYLFSWLSVSTALSGHYTVNWISYDYSWSSTTLALSYRFDRGYLRLPLAVHFNLRNFYLGGGFSGHLLLTETVLALGEQRIGAAPRLISGEYKYSSPSYMDLFVDLGVDLRWKAQSSIRLLLRLSSAISPASPPDRYNDIIKDSLYPFEAALTVQYSAIIANRPLVFLPPATPPASSP